MPRANRRGPSVKTELINKSREAALNAVQVFNNPLTTFKTETFIVLMIIAWTYLLHAYYREHSVEYRYFTKGRKRRKFDRTKSGSFKYWNLERCLNDDTCPLDRPTKQNLQFLIGLRHEIEHHRPAGVDHSFSDRYLACCLNFERYICELFGPQFSLGTATAFTLQFRDLAKTDAPTESLSPLPSNVTHYLEQFDGDVSDEDLQSPHFRRRFLLVPVVTSKKAQADAVFEFVPANSDLGSEVNRRYLMLKEVERNKLLPSEVVQAMRNEGFANFGIYHHTQLWKKTAAKSPGKGYGVQIAKTWYWYDRWVKRVREHCTKHKGKYT